MQANDFRSRRLVCSWLDWRRTDRSLTQVSFAAAPVFPVPRTGGYLRAMMNVNQGLPGYSVYMGPEVLLTDLEFQFGQVTSVQNYAEVKSWFTSHFPKAQLGSYCSSRALTPASSQEFDPPNCLTPDLFAESELLPTTFLDFGRRIVDYRQASARANWLPAWCSMPKRRRSNGCLPIIGRTPAPGPVTSPGATPSLT